VSVRMERNMHFGDGLAVRQSRRGISFIVGRT
jgi:hypothetical protein